MSRLSTQTGGFKQLYMLPFYRLHMHSQAFLHRRVFSQMVAHQPYRKVVVSVVRVRATQSVDRHRLISLVKATASAYTLPVLHDGLSYSAGVNFEHENAHISDTAYVSSGQLGVSYGRMGRVWYSGVDLSFQQSAVTDDVSIKNETVSFDLTTGRRLGWTGLGAGNPLWLLSLRGDFDLQNDETTSFGGSSPDGDWFLNPSLFWDTPDFRFAAQLEVPIGRDPLSDDFDPDSPGTDPVLLYSRSSG